MAKQSAIPKNRIASWFVLVAKLLSVGFSLRQSVQFSQRVMPKDQVWLKHVEQLLVNGNSFAEAIREVVDTDLYVQLVLAEQHGQLRSTLSELGDFLLAEQRQRRKLIALMQYPILLLALLSAMIVALSIFVYPELQTWQGSQVHSVWQKLPWQELMAFALSFLFVALLAYYRCWQKKDVEERVRERCHWPVVGKMYRQYYGYYLISTIAMLLGHGLSLKECCHVATAFNNGSLLCWWGRRLSQINQGGRSMVDIIENCPYLPAELTIFLQQGLTQERLAEELAVFGHMLFKRLLATIERLLIFVQPLMFGLVAIMIIGMYMSILLPIYHSLQGVY